MKWLFLEKCKVNQEKSKKDFPQLTWKQNCKTWNRKIVSGLGFLAFFTLVGIVIFNIYGSSCNPDAKMYYNDVEINQKCTVSNCKVICSDIDEEVMSVAEYINEALEKVNCNSITELSIVHTKYKDSELNNGWLTNIEPEVKELTIQNCTLEKINTRAFADHPFNNIKYLTIVDAELKTLTKHSFLDLHTLVRFAFRNDGSPKSLKIETRVLEGMNRNLEDLQISKYILSPEDIINLTGNEELNLPKLAQLTLEYNSISELKNNSFISATNIISLYLYGNGLSKIHQNTFRWQISLKLLDLSINNLVTLPQDVFNGPEKLNKGGIALSHNKWKCDCSLQWLKDYYINTNTINKENPPICFPENKKFDEIDFCPVVTSTVSTLSSEASMSSLSTVFFTEPLSSSSSSSSPSSPSSLETAEITTELPPGFARIKCRDCIHRVEVEIESKNIELEFRELDEDPLKVEIRTKEDLTDYNMLWFNVDDKEENGCRTIVEDKMLLDELKRDTMYSFSLKHVNKSQVSPKCTFCIRTKPDWKFSPWIHHHHDNKHQVAVIASAVLITIFLNSITAVVTYLCIRRHPKLIAGNKSVIILKRKKEIPSMECERPAYWDPPLVPSSHGYLTPTYHRYSTIRHRPPLIRSFSEWSFTNTTNESSCQYVDPRHLQALKMPRPRRQNPNEIVTVDVHDHRPPLPPRNPLAKRVITQKELYNSV